MNMFADLAVSCNEEHLLTQAKALALRLHLPVDNSAAAQLLLSSERLLLKVHGFLPLCANFQSSYWQKRQKTGKKQALVRACKPARGVRIIDATAGWGRDAAILASFGADVLMLERNPIMAELLNDALKHRDVNSPSALLLKLLCVDAISFLNALPSNKYPDVIYVDPMHPVRQKAALVKKDLQVLQQLIGADKDALTLIAMAKRRVLKKVVVKWPQQLPALTPPSASIPGKTVRFDIYLPEDGLAAGPRRTVCE